MRRLGPGGTILPELIAGGALAVLVLALATGRVSARYLFTADGLYPFLFARDVLAGMPLRGWALPPAPVFFPDLPLALGLVALTDSLRLPAEFALYASVAVYGTFFYAVVWRFLNAVAGESSAESSNQRRWAAALVLVWVCVSYLAGVRRAGLECIFVAGFHGSVFVLALLSIALTLEVLRGSDRAWPRLAALSALHLLALISDRLYLVYGFLALFAALLVAVVWAPVPRRRVVLALAPVLVALLAARPLTRILLAPHFYLWNASPDLGGLATAAGWVRLGTLARDFAATVSAADLVLLLASVVVLVYLARSTGAEGNLRRWFVLLSVFWLGGALVGGVATSFATHSPVAVPRYFLPLAVVPILLAALGLVVFVGPVSRRVLVWCAVLVVLFGTAAVRPAPTEQVPPEIALARCLDEHSEEFGGGCGLADYWNSKPVRFFSRRNVCVNQVEYHLTPAHWLSNYAWYYSGARRGYTFVVTERLNEAELLRRFARPARVLACGGTQIWVYDRPGDAGFRSQLSPAALDAWALATGRHLINM